MHRLLCSCCNIAPLCEVWNSMSSTTFHFFILIYFSAPHFSAYSTCFQAHVLFPLLGSCKVMLHVMWVYDAAFHLPVEVVIFSRCIPLPLVCLIQVLPKEWLWALLVCCHAADTVAICDPLRIFDKFCGVRTLLLHPCFYYCFALAINGLVFSHGIVVIHTAAEIHALYTWFFRSLHRFVC